MARFSALLIVVFCLLPFVYGDTQCGATYGTYQSVYFSPDTSFPFVNTFSTYTQLLVFEPSSSSSQNLSNPICNPANSNPYRNALSISYTKNAGAHSSSLACVVLNTTAVQEQLNSLSFSVGGLARECWCSLPQPPTNHYITGYHITFTGHLLNPNEVDIQQVNKPCSIQITSSSTPLQQGDLFWQNVTIISQSSQSSSPVSSNAVFILAIVLGILAFAAVVTLIVTATRFYRHRHHHYHH